MAARVSSPVLPTVSRPRLANFFCISGSASTLSDSARTLSRMGCGVPAGASRANHDVASKPGNPASTMVGRSGALDERLSEVMAMPRTRPSRTSGRLAPAFWMPTGTTPPMTSARLAPRYGMCSILMPARWQNSSPATCCGVPTPGVPYDSLPGLALA